MFGITPLDELEPEIVRFRCNFPTTTPHVSLLEWLVGPSIGLSSIISSSLPILSERFFHIVIYKLLVMKYIIKRSLELKV